VRGLASTLNRNLQGTDLAITMRIVIGFECFCGADLCTELVSDGKRVAVFRFKRGLSCTANNSPSGTCPIGAILRNHHQMWCALLNLLSSFLYYLPTILIYIKYLVK
jgi:hypothetical protein